MYPFKYAPVNFGTDINTLDCRPLGQPYIQLVQQTDNIMFQLPNLCRPELQTDVWAMTDTGKELWYMNGTAHEVALDFTNQESELEYTLMDFGGCIKGYVCFTVAGIQEGGTVDKGLYLKTVDASGNVLTTIQQIFENGQYCICFDVGEAAGIGFAANAGLEGVGTATYSFDAVTVRCGPDCDFTCEMQICILDVNDDVIATLDESYITQLTNHVQVSFNWNDGLVEIFPGVFQSLPDGCYRISICQGDYEGVLTSQWYSLKAVHECSVLLSWTNNEDAYGFDYSAGLTHYLRVEGSVRNPKYGGEKQIFADSAGNRTILNASKLKKYELIVTEQPEYVHDALGIGIDHDHFYIDGVEYFVEEADYNPIWRKSSALAPVIIDVAASSQNLVNRLC